MKSMKGSHLAENLASLRRSRGLSQEKAVLPRLGPDSLHPVSGGI